MTNIGSSKIDRARLSSSASSSPRILTCDTNTRKNRCSIVMLNYLFFNEDFNCDHLVYTIFVRSISMTNDENITISNNNKSNVQSESDVLQYIDNRVNQLNEKLISNSSKLDQLMQKLYVKIDRLTSNIQY
ncbi:unnamed protein product, partial [Rotaria magnacalcarata]